MKNFKIIIDNIEYSFIMGENVKENHLLIDNSDPNDWWFHLDNLPSCHCVLENSNISDDLIKFGGNIVKSNSKYKDNKNLKIIYLQIKNIKKTKNPGEVSLLNNPKYFII
jgi:predicted ribosome quality control (RQC) complex YloA/Tae2 family protein